MNFDFSASKPKEEINVRLKIKYRNSIKGSEHRKYVMTWLLYAQSAKQVDIFHLNLVLNHVHFSTSPPPVRYVNSTRELLDTSMMEDFFNEEKWTCPWTLLTTSCDSSHASKQEWGTNRAVNRTQCFQQNKILAGCIVQVVLRSHVQAWRGALNYQGNAHWPSREKSLCWFWEANDGKWGQFNYVRCGEQCSNFE